jgi:hypothetical protein
MTIGDALSLPGCPAGLKEQFIECRQASCRHPEAHYKTLPGPPFLNDQEST